MILWVLSNFYAILTGTTLVVTQGWEFEYFIFIFKTLMLANLAEMVLALVFLGSMSGAAQVSSCCVKL